MGLPIGSPAYALPPNVLEYRDLAQRIVAAELMPLEQEYLAYPHNSFSTTKDFLNLERAFKGEKLERLIKVARDTGLWYMMVPEEHGGLGLSLLEQVVVLEQFMYSAVPFPFAHVPNILYSCKGDQVDRFLKPVIEGQKSVAFAQTEPNAGSDPGGMMQTRAVKDGSSWVLNGTKMWISMAAECDFMMVQAVTDPEKRQRGGITMFLVNRNNPGVHVVEPGIRTWLSTHSGQYTVHFDDCRVPEEDVLGEVGKGFNLAQKWLTIHDRLLRGPFAIGKMQRALDMSIAWSKQRVTFGKPISERQAIQWKMVEMAINTQALRSLTYDMAARAEAGEDLVSEAAMVKICGTEWGAAAVDSAIQIHGGMGESLDLPLTLFYRHLRHAQIGGGTNEIQRMLIARKLLRD